MIIIEGPEKSGKTSLAQHLSKLIHIPIHTIQGGSKNKHEAIAKARFAIDNHDKFIFDGSPFIKEAVYRAVRETSNENFIDDEKIYDEFNLCDPRIVYCRPPDEYLLNARKLGCSDKDDPRLIEATLARQRVIVAFYDLLMWGKDGKGGIPHIPYDFTKTTLDNYLGSVKDEISKMDSNINKTSSADGGSASFIQGKK